MASKQTVQSVNLTNANAKAAGLDGNGSSLDGYILMNDLSKESAIKWDYDVSRSTAIGANSLDFLSVALHETGHILGFVSGVDDPGWLSAISDATSSGSSGKDKKSKKGGKGKGSGEALDIEDMTYTTALDLFRYGEESDGKGDARLDMSIGGDAYFSIDGGDTNLADFATGKELSLGGDGYQASHWQHNPNSPIGIMDPALELGERRTISSRDLQALDVIGWDRNQGYTHLNYGALENQALQSLATDAKTSVNGLLKNPKKFEKKLTQDRLYDVEQLIQNSEIYEWGRGSRSRYRQEFDFNKHKKNGKGNKKNNSKSNSDLFDLIMNLFWQQGKFATLDQKGTDELTGLPSEEAGGRLQITNTGEQTGADPAQFTGGAIRSILFAEAQNGGIQQGGNNSGAANTGFEQQTLYQAYSGGASTANEKQSVPSTRWVGFCRAGSCAQV